MPKIILYGITNCNTVKKARAWLAAQQIDYAFVDFKKQVPASSKIQLWIDTVGSDKLINKKGMTWRQLDATLKENINAKQKLIEIIQSHLTLLKRPIIEWKDGSISVGYDEAYFAQQI